MGSRLKRSSSPQHGAVSQAAEVVHVPRLKGEQGSDSCACSEG
jgi:hypothetical protein